MADIDVPTCHSTKTALFDEEHVACTYLERFTRFSQCKFIYRVRPRDPTHHVNDIDFRHTYCQMVPKQYSVIRLLILPTGNFRESRYGQK